MLPTPEQLHELIEKLRILIRENEEQQLIADLALEKNRIDAIAKIKAIYPQEVEQSYNRYITPFLDRYAFLKRPSCLAIIKKHAYEPAHTLLLAYLFEHNKAILTALVKSAEHLSGKDELLQHIHASESYQVKAEVQIRNCGKITGRILDLIITDDTNRWVLIIENKIESCFSDGRIGKMQIDDYRIFAERQFREYDRYYLVVSYANDNKREALMCGWGFCNYSMVFNAIIQNIQQDHIAEDYLCALVQLMCRGYQNDNYILSTDQVGMKLCSIRKFYLATILKLEIAI